MLVNPLLDLSARPVIAHRGASGYAPENTLPAFEFAASQGADALELDVRLTADGIPVVIHDATPERTTGRRGSVAGQTLAQLRTTDAGWRFSADGGRTFPFRSSGVVIPSLAEVLEAFPRMPVLLEIKEVHAQDAVRRVLLEQAAVDRCVVAADDLAALAVFSPPFYRAAARQEISSLYWRTLLRPVRAARYNEESPAYQLLSVPARYRGLPVATGALVSAARKAGCPVHAWTVNGAALARRLWARGVAGIVTNFPDVILAAR